MISSSSLSVEEEVTSSSLDEELESSTLPGKRVMSFSSSSVVEVEVSSSSVKCERSLVFVVLQFRFLVCFCFPLPSPSFSIKKASYLFLATGLSCCDESAIVIPSRSSHSLEFWDKYSLFFCEFAISNKILLAENSEITLLLLNNIEFIFFYL